MATPRSPSSRGDAPMDSAPLLGGGGQRRRGVLRGAARLLRRGGRRAMREPSLRVREAAAEELEERQADWAYSRPVVALDLLWNLAFILVSAVVLVLSHDESLSMPLRLWIAGYAAQCAVHMVCVAIEYRMRHGHRGGAIMAADDEIGSGASSSSSDDDDGERGSRGLSGDFVSIAKHLESANTMFSFIWWIIGFYWVSAGGEVLTRDAPQLYWHTNFVCRLCIIFLAFDVFFVVFCVALACIIGIAVCCCLPCIIAILYAVSDQEGASEDDIRQIPKYKFQRVEEPEKQSVSVTGSSGGLMIECGTNQPIEKVLAAEDAECCICLSSYDDGAELRELPCGHHFHCACIDKWLHINATCPLCKYNVRKNTSSSGSEEV
ncbi:E3 ubiquitin-protein ligase At1g63170-like isoform X1 [Phragmites australis]|uniref:E3 ubiquitin-protein ligase At1g63170-like isoform X1 n=1 Tax=Phragmites australis TaxID=29695 RepID=UPI002D787A32|nr:E3 ubiquitin-protein ligase At1g63170-like isoform X1 [Phragmites australis]